MGGAILCFDKMVEKGIDAGYAAKLIQYGWETQTEALKQGGVTGMLDRLDNPSKVKCVELAAQLKEIMRPLYEKHQDDIISGEFSRGMMAMCKAGVELAFEAMVAVGMTHESAYYES